MRYCVEGTAKLLCPEKQMILRPCTRGSKAATVHSTRPTPSGFDEKNGRTWPQKGDFNGHISCVIPSLGTILKTVWLMILCCLTVACGSSPKTVYQVGVDPSWYPILLDGKEKNLTGFSTEILQEIGKKENISISKVSVSWDALLEGLKKGQYAGILYSMQPYNFNEQTYDFSDLYLKTGPVLVMSTSYKYKSLTKLSGKEIAVTSDSGIAILEKYPNILIRSYDSIAQALNDVNAGIIEGAVVDRLMAESYCQDLYEGKLKIVTGPLNDAGLRLITLKDQAPELMKAFNKGLQKLKSSKEYDKLLKKWSLMASDK